ncbi:MAG: PAS domain S-box protein [Candidatus Latescibacteria bacterium]|nr:PAS domain S-box protein [Candidatus Latescibacterota bacterium]
MVGADRPFPGPPLSRASETDGEGLPLSPDRLDGRGIGGPDQRDERPGDGGGDPGRPDGGGPLQGADRPQKGRHRRPRHVLSRRPGTPERHVRPRRNEDRRGPHRRQRPLLPRAAARADGRAEGVDGTVWHPRRDDERGRLQVDRDFQITFFNKRMEEITGYPQEEALGRPMSLLYDGESLAKVHSELEKRRSGRPSVYEAEMITRSGARVPVTISGVPIHDGAGNYTGSFGVITDISQRVEAERELRHRSDVIARLLDIERKRAAQLSMVGEIARLVLSTLDPDQIMRLSAESIQRNFAYYDVFLFAVDEAAGEVLLTAHAGAYLEFFSEGYRQAIGTGIVGWVAQTGEVLLSNDVAKEPRRILAFPQEEKTASELCVPIKLGDRVIGGIDVQSERTGAFDEHDVTSLQILANLIANAVENARLYQEMKFVKEFNERVIDTIPMPLLFPGQRLENRLRQPGLLRAKGTGAGRPGGPERPGGLPRLHTPAGRRPGGDLHGHPGGSVRQAGERPAPPRVHEQGVQHVHHRRGAGTGAAGARRVRGHHRGRRAGLSTLHAAPGDRDDAGHPGPRPAALCHSHLRDRGHGPRLQPGDPAPGRPEAGRDRGEDRRGARQRGGGVPYMAQSGRPEPHAR